MMFNMSVNGDAQGRPAGDQASLGRRLPLPSAAVAGA
jgi:hypothetical protein